MRHLDNSERRVEAINFNNCGMKGAVHPGKYDTAASKEMYKVFDWAFDCVEGIHIIILHNVYNPNG